MTLLFGNVATKSGGKDATISAKAEKAGMTGNHLAAAEAKIRATLAKAERFAASKDKGDRELASMHRADARDMQRVLDLVLSGDFAEAGHKLDHMDTDPRDEIGQILKGPISRGRKLFTPKAQSYFY